jgi:hypothetical protein
MHPSENELRAYQDGQLPEAEQEHTAAHLAECSECQAALSGLATRAEQVNAALDALAPTPAEARRTASSAAAWRKFEQKLQEKPSMSKRLARLRPLWIGLTLIAVLAVAFSFPSVQALASNFLRLFRVQQIAVLPLDMTNLKDARFDPTIGETISQVLSDQVKITRQPGQPHDLSGASQASQEAGFQVRLSSDPAQSLSRLMLQPGIAFEGTFNQALAETVLQSFGKGDLPLPAGLDGAVVKANIPDSVTAAYGKCRYNTAPESRSATGGETLGIGDKCLLLVQMPSPTVDTPPDLPINQLAELGLQVMGMAPDKAAQVASQIDWTTTLVIPIPRGEMDSQTVKVDGTDGTLLRQLSSDSSMAPTYSLVWVKNGIVYGILGSGDPARAVDLGNSLQ